MPRVNLALMMMMTMMMMMMMHVMLSLTKDTNPPEAPITSLTRPFLSVKMAGQTEDCGLFPSLMKLLLKGSMFEEFASPGVENRSV